MERENVSGPEVTVMHSLISEVTGCHCHILFAVGKSLGPTHALGEGVRPGAWAAGSHLRGCWSQA